MTAPRRNLRVPPASAVDELPRLGEYRAAHHHGKRGSERGEQRCGGTQKRQNGSQAGHAAPPVSSSALPCPGGGSGSSDGPRRDRGSPGCSPVPP